MSLSVVERSPGLPFVRRCPSGAVDTNRRSDPAQGQHDAMRERWGCGQCGPRPRSAVDAATPCEASVETAAPRRGTRPLTGTPSGSDRSKPEGLRRTNGLTLVERGGDIIAARGSYRKATQTRCTSRRDSTAPSAQRLVSAAQLRWFNAFGQRLHRHAALPWRPREKATGPPRWRSRTGSLAATSRRSDRNKGSDVISPPASVRLAVNSLNISKVMGSSTDNPCTANIASMPHIRENVYIHCAANKRKLPCKRRLARQSASS
jgi:hypothetical protein